VRNLARFPEFSFWLPTASDRFYPDFVAELEDGRLLVVEYKGEGYKSADDAIEKQRVGELWARLSGNLFLLAVERDAQGRGVTEQLRACVGGVAIAEHARVVALVDIAFDGGAVPAGSVGTVVSVYDEGAGYAIEFGAVAGEMGVVFAAAGALRRVPS
jgi:type III restriction enzyme